jgi:hypothetical protein
MKRSLPPRLIAAPMEMRSGGIDHCGDHDLIVSPLTSRASRKGYRIELMRR